nr:hypothetical protein Iba_chr07cCG15260 [Ipomoea batatas]
MAGISSSLAKTASPSSTPSSSAMAYALPSSEPPGGTFGSWPSKSRLSNIIQDLQSNHEHKPETLICKLHQFQKKGRTQRESKMHLEKLGWSCSTFRIDMASGFSPIQATLERCGCIPEATQEVAPLYVDKSPVEHETHGPIILRESDL